MTIVVGVAAPEGRVLAGDSRATIVDDNERHRIASDSVQKVFKVGRFGVADYGALLIGNETVAGLMDQFTATTEDDPPESADSLAAGLQEFFSSKLNAALDEPWDVDSQSIALGFLVCGYDGEGIGHLHHVTVPASGSEVDVTTATGGMLWQGQGDAINRLIYGFDAARLANAEVEFSEEAQEALTSLTYRLNY